MANLIELGDCTARRSRTELPRSAQLIMHWMDPCTEVNAHRQPGRGSSFAHQSIYRTPLIAVWVEAIATPQGWGINPRSGSQAFAEEE